MNILTGALGFSSTFVLATGQAIDPCTLRHIPLASSGPTLRTEKQRKERHSLTVTLPLLILSSASERTNCMTKMVSTISFEYYVFPDYTYSNILRFFAFSVCMDRNRSGAGASGYLLEVMLAC